MGRAWGVICIGERVIAPARDKEKGRGREVRRYQMRHSYPQKAGFRRVTNGGKCRTFGSRPTVSCAWAMRCFPGLCGQRACSAGKCTVDGILWEFFFFGPLTPLSGIQPPPRPLAGGGGLLQGSALGADSKWAAIGGVLLLLRLLQGASRRGKRGHAPPLCRRPPPPRLHTPRRRDVTPLAAAGCLTCA